MQKLFTLSSSLFSQFTSALWGIARFLNSAVWRGVYVQRDGKTSNHLFPFSLASFFFLFFLALKKKNLTKQKFNMENIISMPIYLNILAVNGSSSPTASWAAGDGNHWRTGGQTPSCPEPGLWCSHSLASKTVWGQSRKPCRYWALVDPGNASDSDKWESLEEKGRLETLGVQWLKWIERKIKRRELSFGEQSLLD